MLPKTRRMRVVQLDDVGEIEARTRRNVKTNYSHNVNIKKVYKLFSPIHGIVSQPTAPSQVKRMISTNHSIHKHSLTSFVRKVNHVLKEEEHHQIRIRSYVI